MCAININCRRISAICIKPLEWRRVVERNDSVYGGLIRSQSAIELNSRGRERCARLRRKIARVLLLRRLITRLGGETQLSPRGTALSSNVSRRRVA